MNPYAELQNRLARGWNTWNTRSVLSHVHLPGGFALNLGIKQFKLTQYLKEALIARPEQREERVQPGLRSYDGSYTELCIEWKGVEIRVQSVAERDTLALLITPLVRQRKTPLVVVEAGMLWNRPGYVCRSGNSLKGHTPDKDFTVYATGALVEDPHIPAQTAYLALPLDAPVGITTEKPCSLAEITARVEQARKSEEKRVAGYGDLAEVYEAIQTCMAWNTIYEPERHAVVAPVSRVFNSWKGGYILFCWDAYFAAYMAAIDHRDLAYANAIEMTREAKELGFVPNYVQAAGIKSCDRSQPPVGSLVIRELFRRYRDEWLLEHTFDNLLKWNRWWRNHRKNEQWLSWGSNPFEPVADMYWESAGVNDTFGAALESGLDNSPMYDDVPFDKNHHVLQLADVGLTGLYVADCRCLAELADVLGRTDEAGELRETGDRFAVSLEALWDNASGIYLNRRTDTGQPSQRLSPTNFYPLIGGVPSQSRAERMIAEHFYNPNEFWGEWILPSIARNDPAYPDQHYWRGCIWAPMNFLVYLGLRKYDLARARHDLVEKSKALFLRGWRANRYVCENYHAETGEGGQKGSSSDCFYHWGGLLGLMAFIEQGCIPAPEEPLG